MKKFNITSEKLATIGFTIIVWICVLIAAAYALKNSTNIYGDAIYAIGSLCAAGLFEWAKYKITHPCKDNTQG